LLRDLLVEFKNKNTKVGCIGTFLKFQNINNKMISW
jgi:hypothetical protein